METEYATMRLDLKDLEKLMKQKKKMRKSSAGDVLHSVVNLIDQQKSWGELK